MRAVILFFIIWKIYSLDFPTKQHYECIKTFKDLCAKSFKTEKLKIQCFNEFHLVCSFKRVVKDKKAIFKLKERICNSNNLSNHQVDILKEYAKYLGAGSISCTENVDVINIK